MITFIKTHIPTSLEPIVTQTWRLCRPIIRLIFHGKSRYCPICKSYNRLFLSHGPLSRKIEDVVCPVCLSHPRHRFAWIYLYNFYKLIGTLPKTFLHIAPEPEFEKYFKHIEGINYLSVDISNPHAMIRMDITNMSLHASSFDAVFCSHVLEHVPNDKKAMGEIFRTLKPGGWAIIQVPIGKGKTIEDLTITDPIQRRQLYWKSDHVRLYGLDIKKRLLDVGFDVEQVRPDRILTQKDRKIMSISEGEQIFHCWKPA